MKSFRISLQKIYNKLFLAFGPQYWWPADIPFEIIIGAILTQNTNWKNAAKAIHHLKISNCLTPQAIQKISITKLAKLIRPAGYYNLKARRLKEFNKFLFCHYQGNLKIMFHTKYPQLRQELLGIKGIGPETADSILLYAGNKPIFVVDAYTKRIFSRHHLCAPESSYSQIQDIFMNNLPRQTKLFNEYHALIVMLGKEYCKKIPLCAQCPLK